MTYVLDYEILFFLSLKVVFRVENVSVWQIRFFFFFYFFRFNYPNV